MKRTRLSISWAGMAAVVAFAIVMVASLTFAAPTFVDVTSGVYTQLATGDQRDEHTAVYYPGPNQVIVYGGEVRNGDVFPVDVKDDTRAFSFDPPPRGSWRTVSTTGTGPGELLGHVAVFDNNSRRMVVWGGARDRSRGGSGQPAAGTPITLRDELYFLDFTGVPPTTAAWSQMTPTGTRPSARTDAAADYSPDLDMMVIHAGRESNRVQNDTKFLMLGDTVQWRSGPSGGPTLWGHSMSYDSRTQRMLVFGGTNRLDGSASQNTVYQLDLSGGIAAARWSTLSTTGTPPGPRFNHVSAYDPTNNVLWIHAGTRTQGGSEQNDFWNLDLDTSPPTWRGPISEPGAPGTRESHTGTGTARGLVIYGGERTDRSQSDTTLWVPTVGGPPPTATLVGPAPTNTPGAPPPPTITRVAPTSTPTLIPPPPTQPPSRQCSTASVSGATLVVRIFLDYRCDGYYNRGWDDVVAGAQITVDGQTKTTDSSGIAVFSDVSASPEAGVLAVLPDNVAGFELVPCKCENPRTLCGSDFGFANSHFLSFGFGPRRRADPRCGGAS